MFQWKPRCVLALSVCHTDTHTSIEVNYLKLFAADPLVSINSRVNNNINNCNKNDDDDDDDYGNSSYKNNYNNIASQKKTQKWISNSIHVHAWTIPFNWSAPKNSHNMKDDGDENSESVENRIFFVLLHKIEKIRKERPRKLYHSI